MSLDFVYNGSSLGTAAVRLGQVPGFTSSAEKGTVGIGLVPVDDPTAALALDGLHDFYVTESSCSVARLFTGYLGPQDVARGQGDSLITGGARRWQAELLDENAGFNFRIITGSDGNRPSETDAARIAWLLGSAYLDMADHGLVDTATTVLLDSADYRGQYPDAVLNDCSDASGKNYSARYRTASDDIELLYFKPTSTLDTATIAISNVLSDVNGTTVLAPMPSASIRRDPSRVYQGVYMTYQGGSVYISRPSGSYIFRDVAASAGNVHSSTTARAQANHYLDQTDTQDERITVSVRIPKAQVNLALAGQRISVRFSEMPNFTSATYIRIVKRTVKQDEESDQFYSVEFELCNLKLMSTKRSGAGGGSPVPPPTGPQVIDGTGNTCIDLGSWTPGGTPAPSPVGTTILWGPGPDSVLPNVIRNIVLLPAGTTYGIWRGVLDTPPDGDYQFEFQMQRDNMSAPFTTTLFLIINRANDIPGGIGAVSTHVNNGVTPNFVLSERLVTSPIGDINPTLIESLTGTIYWALMQSTSGTSIKVWPATDPEPAWTHAYNQILGTIDRLLITNGRLNTGLYATTRDMTWCYDATSPAVPIAYYNIWTTVVPVSTGDGTTTTFTLPAVPGGGILMVEGFVNGVLEPATFDTIARTVTFTVAPNTGDDVEARWVPTP